MARSNDPQDPKGLLREAYRIDGITGPVCRTIFMDWALSIAGEQVAMIPDLIARYGADTPEHPMTIVLREGLASAPKPKRRGGRMGRRGG